MKIVGILNATPDSFYDHGKWFGNTKVTVEHGLRLFAEGADIVEVGGESVRPGAQAVPADMQIERVCSVIKELSGHGIIGIDTRSPVAARAALECGASFINEVGCNLYPVAAEAKVGYVATHIQGEPATMQVNPSYDDVVAEVTAQLLSVATHARAAGVPELWIDPGIGMGKRPEHNFALLKALPDLVSTGVPVLLAVSRKIIIGQLSGQPDVARRLAGSLAAVGYAEDAGVDIIRVHDVRETAEFLRLRSGLRKAALDISALTF